MSRAKRIPRSRRLPECEIESVLAYEPEQLVAFFNSVKGIGQSLAQEIVATLGVTGALYALEHEPQQLMAFRNLKQKKLEAILRCWKESDRVC